MLLRTPVNLFAAADLLVLGFGIFASILGIRRWSPTA
jgi:hypothetical protein